MAPKIAYSCQASGRMSSGPSTTAAINANTPDRPDPKREVLLDRVADSIIRTTSTRTLSVGSGAVAQIHKTINDATRIVPAYGARENQDNQCLKSFAYCTISILPGWSVYILGPIWSILVAFYPLLMPTDTKAGLFKS